MRKAISAQPISQDCENKNKKYSDRYQYHGPLNCYRLNKIKVLFADYLK